MYNNTQALLWVDGKAVNFKVLQSDQDVTDFQQFLVRLALDQIDESNISITGDKNLWDGIIVDGCICEDTSKRWFDIYSIEYIGAEYAALIGG